MKTRNHHEAAAAVTIGQAAPYLALAASLVITTVARVIRRGKG